MLVDWKDSVGNFSTSKKSALLRCVSRWASPVLMEAASIEASTRELVKSVASRSRTPLTFVNCPFTFEIIMCFTLNSAAEWTGSMFHVVVAAFGAASAFMSLLLSGFTFHLMRYTDNRCNRYLGQNNQIIWRRAARKSSVN